MSKNLSARFKKRRRKQLRRRYRRQTSQARSRTTIIRVLLSEIAARVKDVQLDAKISPILSSRFLVDNPRSEGAKNYESKKILAQMQAQVVAMLSLRFSKAWIQASIYKSLRSINQRREESCFHQSYHRSPRSTTLPWFSFLAEQVETTMCNGPMPFFTTILDKKS